MADRSESPPPAITRTATLTIDGVTVRIRTQSTLCNLLKKQGITLGRTIFLRGHINGIRPALLAHEFRHVLQFERLGWCRFLWQYVTEWVRHGYGLDHALESEAYGYAVRAHERFGPVVDGLRKQMAGL